jgi:hypothetical protein
MSTAAPLGLRLFLEGIEVPVIAAQVQSQADVSANAAIQIVPTDAALNFLPRTTVHLFYLDDKVPLSTSVKEEEHETLALNGVLADDNRYRVMFIGEVIGYTYTKRPDNRSLVLQCMDLSSYWDACYQWFADYSIGGNAFTDRQHTFVGAGVGQFNNIAAGHKWVIAQILKRRPANPAYSRTKGLLRGIISLMESVGGLRPARGGEGYAASVRGVNDFFTLAEMRYTLTGMVGAVEEDTTSANMYSAKAFFGWLRNGMTSLGNLVSFRDLIKHLGAKVFHNVYPMTSPLYIPTGKRNISEIESWKSDRIKAPSIQKEVREAIAIIETVKRTYSPLEEGQTLQLDVGYSLEPITDAARKLATAAQQGLEVRGDGAWLQRRVRNALSRLEQFKAQMQAKFAIKDAQFKSAVYVQGGVIAAVGLLTEAVGDLKRVLTPVRVGRRVERDVVVSARLLSQLVLPETFMMVPPRCNVIFPEQYMELTYSRNFLREVTRLSCHGGWGVFGGDSKLLANHYYAPPIKGLKGKNLLAQDDQAVGLLMPHEIYSGIIPKFEWVSDGHRYGRRAAGAGTNAAEGRKVRYVQRLANFKFFLNRWGARQMSVRMRFSPQIALGFPAVVVDRSTPSAAQMQAMKQQQPTGKLMLPTAFLGKVANLTHNINQQGGGMTSVTLQYARTHRATDDEFLGVLHREQFETSSSNRAIQVQTLARNLIRNARENIDLFDRRLAQLIVAGTLVEGAEIIGLKITNIKRLGGSVTLSSSEIQALGLTEDSLLNPEGISVPHTVSVDVEGKEAVGAAFSADSGAPIEEQLTPGWYDDAWSTDRITETVYGPLLGTKAITDDEAINSDEDLRKLIKNLFQVEGDAGVTEYNESQVETRGGDVVITSSRPGEGAVGPSKITLTFGKKRSIERAIDGLTLMYGLVRKRNLDVNQFVKDYTRRPIATMPQILGSRDLSYGEQAGKAVVTSGEEGFHSRAVGDYNVDVAFTKSGEDVDVKAGVKAMFNLTDTKEDLNKPERTALNRKLRDKIPEHLDPRGVSRQRVRVYMAELNVSRGLSGG